MSNSRRDIFSFSKTVLCNKQIQRATDSPKRSLLLIFTKSNIDIVANTPETGEAKESLAVMYQGREFSIAFNPEFLMAPLRNLSEEEIYLDLIDELSPRVIKIDHSCTS